MTTHPALRPRCSATHLSASGTKFVCTLPAGHLDPGAHYFVADARSARCPATRSTLAGITFACALRAHPDDPDGHFFRDQVPVAVKKHLTAYQGGAQ